LSQSGAVMGYYVADDIPYHWALAANFALCDQYFCSVLSGTGPNRMYAVGGQSFLLTHLTSDGR